jgi:hypothetical protein
MKTISDHILDILQNSVRAGATLIEIIVFEDKTSDIYSVDIKDNGSGMTADAVEKAINPFFTTRTTRKVGLGLPLLKQNAETSGGSLKIWSEPGAGTTVRAEFGLKHLDRPPMGDIAGVFVLSAIGHPDTGFSYKHVTDTGSFSISTAEINEMLEGTPLRTPEIRKAVTELVRNQLLAVQASA